MYREKNLLSICSRMQQVSRLIGSLCCFPKWWFCDAYCIAICSCKDAAHCLLGNIPHETVCCCGASREMVGLGRWWWWSRSDHLPPSRRTWSMHHTPSHPWCCIVIFFFSPLIALQFSSFSLVLFSLYMNFLVSPLSIFKQKIPLWISLLHIHFFLDMRIRMCVSIYLNSIFFFCFFRETCEANFCLDSFSDVLTAKNINDISHIAAK